MKRLFLPCLLLASAIAPATAQNRYNYQHAPNGDCEVIDPYYERNHRPILGRLAHDLRIAREEIDKSLFGVRDEIRRVVHGRSYPTEVYHAPPRVDPIEQEDVSYRADESYGRFSQDTLERARLRAAERERLARRDAIIQRGLEQRSRDLAQRTAPQQRRRPLAQAPPPAKPQVRNSPPPAAPKKEIVKPLPEPQPALDKVTAPKLNSKPQPPAKTDPQPRPEPEPPKFTEAEKRNFPLARKTDKPGFVRSPYPPFELLDVTGIAPGDLAMEPEGDRIFRIPE